MTKITIAIDGFSSTGKSTIAKQLANALGYVYVDSGAMYRAVTLHAMNKGFISDDHFDVEGLINDLPNLTIFFKFNNKLGIGEVFLNDVNVEGQIRNLEVSRKVSQVAAISEVRVMLVKQQQRMGQFKGVVMDGRDIGTVVFPDAELKLFMTSSAETRAQRRYDELIASGDDVEFKDILENVVSRDHIDSTREDSPLVKAEDAIEIDNSHLTKTEQFDQVLEMAYKIINHIE
ncbi:MAG: cytidylate kinase [Bacteroidetes bacterium MedPE-SWsnd-G2]|nr:MAG: cytidylate kinase [Bacteroidetes bacterium MedPE-SWsnd-G2]